MYTEKSSDYMYMVTKIPEQVHKSLHYVIYSYLAAAATANDPEVIELCHVVLHDGSVVAQLPAEVLIVPHPQVHHRTVLHVTQRYHLQRRV